MEFNQPSEIVKDVNFGDKANKKVVAGVKKLAKAVKSTLGASGDSDCGSDFFLFMFFE